MNKRIHLPYPVWSSRHKTSAEIILRSPMVLIYNVCIAEIVDNGLSFSRSLNALGFFILVLAATSKFASLCVLRAGIFLG